jgi:cell division protein FtsW (lipid II flippase)
MCTVNLLLPAYMLRMAKLTHSRYVYFIFIHTLACLNSVILRPFYSSNVSLLAIFSFKLYLTQLYLRYIYVFFVIVRFMTKTAINTHCTDMTIGSSLLLPFCCFELLDRIETRIKNPTECYAVSDPHMQFQNAISDYFAQSPPLLLNLMMTTISMSACSKYGETTPR